MSGFRLAVAQKHKHKHKHKQSSSRIAMENLHSHHKCPRIFFFFFFFFSLIFFFFHPSSADTSPGQYFINCGSDSDATVGGEIPRTFIRDGKSGSFSLSGRSRTVRHADPPPAVSPLYHSARIFTRQSWYEIQIPQNETYILRFHFFVFPSRKSLSDALFNVSTSSFSLLSNFSMKNSTNFPIIHEFLMDVNVGKFRVYFVPFARSSIAFVNAIEAFPATDSFIHDSAPHVTPAGEKGNFTGLFSQILHVVNRFNVGGQKLTPENDFLWRNWVPDDDHLYNKDSARNSSFYSDQLKYVRGLSRYTAPESVYRTAKELNSRQSNVFNITWGFNVNSNSKFLLRAHFCDIISTTNDNLKFNLYVYRNFIWPVNSYEAVSQTGTPFFYDFVADSDDSGLMNISIGPRSDSYQQSAFLNGLEIMQISRDSIRIQVENEHRNNHFSIIIVGSVAGGLAVVSITVAMFLFGSRFRRGKDVVSSDSPSSYVGVAEGTSNGSHFSNLNLGLKIPFAEIVSATNGFDRKLMVGEGGFGKVYRGRLSNGLKVAVKRSEPGHGQGLSEFETEILVLSKIRNRHLVSLVGYCNEGSEMILVYEFMERGTLRDHISSSELSWNQRLEICIGAAKGLHYLHTGSDGGGIIHRDVKSTNILLDEFHVAKVADFGLSRSGISNQGQTYVSTQVKGTFGYLDPEYFRCLKLTQKSDVYSFGIVLLEVLCGRPPINNTAPPEEVNLAEWGMKWVKEGQIEKILDPSLVGKIEPNSLRKFGEIAERCLRDYGDERPSMGDVLWDLEYALLLQMTGVRREAHEDSTTATGSSLGLPIGRCFTSISIPIGEDELPLGTLSGVLDSSCSDAGEVFS